MPVCCAGEAHCARVEIDPGLAHKCMNCGGFAKVVAAKKEYRQTNVQAFLVQKKKSTGEGDFN